MEESPPELNEEKKQPADLQEVSEQEPPQSKEEEGGEEDMEAQAPLKCEGIIFESNAVIEGTKLANCMMAAMLAAGTGTHRLESTAEPAAIVDFLWDPDFSLNVREGENSVIIKGNTGWVKNDKGKWIQEEDNSLDPEIQLANIIIKMVRAFSNPMVLRDYIELSPTWIVVGEESVPAEDAVTDIAWHLVPKGPIHLDDITLTDVGLWLTSGYLGAYYVSTSSGMGFTVTSSNTFLQWGEKVEIPDPRRSRQTTLKCI